jgi:hypothetical protein
VSIDSSRAHRGSTVCNHPKSCSEEGLLKGRQKLEQSLGLGATPSVIPEGDVDISGALRTVEIGWHPVAGLAGKWFAEQTGLGRMITEGIHKFPDPTQHWAVLVGDYCHQLWMVPFPLPPVGPEAG